MTFETVFSVASLVAVIGWVLLLASPWIPVWSDRIAGMALPVGLSIGYLVLIALPSETSGGFDSLARVMELFSYEQALLAGWMHYLAFDLFIGAWMCRTARSEGLPFLYVLPCLPLTFLLGPVGLLTIYGLRSVRRAIR